MPQVPYATPQAQAAAAGPDPTYLAMAAAEFLQAARQSPGKSAAPNQSESDAPTDRS